MDIQQKFNQSGQGREVVLQTRDGSPVTAQQIPPFSGMPEVVIWGLRVFQIQEFPIYREVFAWCVPVMLTPEMALEQKARKLYEAYCAAAGWKSAVSGAPLPQWADCSEAVKKCWLAAAEVV
jgi:hypothetical protein